MAEGTDHSIKEMLDAAAASIKRGDIATGHASLVSVLQREPENVSAWLWMSRCFQDRENKLRCFRKVLEIDPDNSHAIEGIRVFSFLSQGKGRKSSASTKWLGLGIGGAVLFVLIGTLSAYAFGLVQLPGAMPATSMAISTDINAAEDEVIGEPESEANNSSNASVSSTQAGQGQQGDVVQTATPIPSTLAPSSPTPEPPTPTPTAIPPTATNIPPTSTDVPPTDVPPTDIPPTDVPPTATNIPPTATLVWVPSSTPSPPFVSCSVDPAVIPAFAMHNIRIEITCQVSFGGQPMNATMEVYGPPEVPLPGHEYSCSSGTWNGIASCSIDAVRLGPGHTHIVQVLITDVQDGRPDVLTQTSYSAA